MHGRLVFQDLSGLLASHCNRTDCSHALDRVLPVLVSSLIIVVFYGLSVLAQDYCVLAVLDNALGATLRDRKARRERNANMRFGARAWRWT